MAKVSDVCRYVRSKNAGPFWITVDLFFRDRTLFETHSGASALSAQAIAELYGVDARGVKWFAVPHLNVLKISYPRPLPQGGVIERDMHGGQQFVRLLSIEL